MSDKPVVMELTVDGREIARVVDDHFMVGEHGPETFRYVLPAAAGSAAERAAADAAYDAWLEAQLKKAEERGLATARFRRELKSLLRALRRTRDRLYELAQKMET